MKKQKSLFKLLSVAAVSAIAIAVLALTGCPNGNDPGAGPEQGPGQVAPAVPITVTITGIPSRYHDSWGELSLRHPETGGYAGWSEVRIEGTSATFALTAIPGIYNLRLWFSSGQYFLASRNITAGSNSIPLSAFTPLEQISITVTGIPDRYIGNVHGSMDLMQPGTLSSFAGTSRTIYNDLMTFTVSAMPGVFDVHLRFRDNDSWVLLRAYSASLRTITVGNNTIPFSAFRACLTSFKSRQGRVK